MKKILVSLLGCLFFVSMALFTNDVMLYAGSNDFGLQQEYSFIIKDSPSQLFTMRQFNEDYFNSYRYLIGKLNDNLGYQSGFWIQNVLQLVFIAVPHEEGHRSILTAKGIGAISQPFFNSKGAAYVIGVRDAELKNLRDTDLPTYIRLHTAGLEADYCLLNRSRTCFAFQTEQKQVLFIEYLYRLLSLVSYYSTSPIAFLEPDIDEEKNELKRDIVGHDVYGAVRHLHRPDAPFYRYTKYADLTREDKSFINRVGYRALLNFIDGSLFQWLNWNRQMKSRWSFGLGYSMCPFGDFIDVNIWFMKNDIKLQGYIREFQNKHQWFSGGGLQLVNYPIINRLTTSAAIHWWNQPEGLNFTTKKSNFGGAIDIVLKYKILKLEESRQPHFLSVDLGVIGKSEGFLPEELYMDKNFGFRIGASVF